MYDRILSKDRCYNQIGYRNILLQRGSYLDPNPLIPETVPNIIGQQSYQYYWLMKLLCLLSIIYTASRPWAGWTVQFVFIIAGTFTWWKFRGYLFMLISCNQSKKLQISIYCLIPWRILSRCWGKFAAIYIPKMGRRYVFGGYCKLFGVNIDETQYPLEHYPTLTDFFTRRLKENSRTILPTGSLVVPCDGTLVHCGLMYGKQIRHVKGIDYHMKTFLGYQPTLTNVKSSKNSTIHTRLYRCVFYLAPGDYHRFHSPCDWIITERTHFYGKLLSVSPIVTKWFTNLLAINERVVYTGKWEHGFFSYTAVGATNVGSITVHGDPTLTTNERRMQGKDHITFKEPFVMRRGQEMGYFSMGSSVVLIFEGPEQFQFSYIDQTLVKLGNQLGISEDATLQFAESLDSNNFQMPKLC